MSGREKASEPVSKSKTKTKDNAKSNCDKVKLMKVRKMKREVRRHLDKIKDITRLKLNIYYIYYQKRGMLTTFLCIKIKIIFS